jgi:hypothetical protein
LWRLSRDGRRRWIRSLIQELKFNCFCIASSSKILSVNVSEYVSGEVEWVMVWGWGLRHALPSFAPSLSKYRSNLAYSKDYKSSFLNAIDASARISKRRSRPHWQGPGGRVSWKLSYCTRTPL